LKYDVLRTIGFKEEYIVWKDEYRNNQNSFSGQLPDGIYEEYATTKIYYCCRSDGYATNPIFLPTDSTFALFKSNTHLCQQVKGLQATSQWFYWDCDDEKGDGVKYSNKRSPYGNIEASKKHDVKIEFCYYHPPPSKKSKHPIRIIRINKTGLGILDLISGVTTSCNELKKKCSSRFYSERKCLCRLDALTTELWSTRGERGHITRFICDTGLPYCRAHNAINVNLISGVTTS